MYFSLVSPFDKNPDPKYKPYIHMKNHNDRWYVIALEEAQNSLDFYQTANGSVLCYITIPPEFLLKIINLKNKSVRFLKDFVKSEEEWSPSKRVKRDQTKQAATYLHHDAKEDVKNESMDNEPAPAAKSVSNVLIAQRKVNEWEPSSANAARHLAD